MIDPVYEDAVQQLKKFDRKKLKSTTKHILTQLMCHLLFNSLVWQATYIDIFSFNITTLIQPLLGVMGAQELFSDAPGCILEWSMPSWSPYEAALVCGWLWTPSMPLLNLSIHVMGELFAYVSDRPPQKLRQSTVCIAGIFLIFPWVLQLFTLQFQMWAAWLAPAHGRRGRDLQ